MSTEVDYYELLEVERTADGNAIKSAYRKLAMKYHPDRTGGCTDSEAKFKAVSAAYECLKDPQKRAAYDRYGHAAYTNAQNGGGGFNGRGAGGFSDLGDIFETIFGQSGFGGGGRQTQRRGADLRYDMEITLDEAYHGKKTEIEIEVSAPCESCDGSGAQPGTGVKTCGTCGGHGQVRAQQGFFVVERTCPGCHGAGLFERDGTTLFCRAPVSFTTAALGGCIEVPGLDGQRHEIKIPSGIQSGKQIRQRGAGMPVLNGRGQGDLVIQVDVETPTRLTAKQKELLEAFRETETGEECPQSTGFFSKLKELWGE